MQNTSRPTGLEQIILSAESLEESMSRIPDTVSKVLQTEPDELLIINTHDLEKYIFDELLVRTRKGRDITPEYIMSLQYVARVFSMIRTPLEFDNYGISKVQERYVTDAYLSEDYQGAGDNALHGFIHAVGKRKNSLRKEDYIDLAEICYYRWYEKKPQSLGQVISKNIRWILSHAENWREDMMMRVPGIATSLMSR